MNADLLIVEPDTDILDSLTRYLQRSGYSVSLARNGPECIASLNRSPPDLLVLEPALPNGWGKRVLAKCALMDASVSLPIIALSQSSRSRFSYPYRAFYVKPISMRILVEKIETILQST